VKLSSLLPEDFFGLSGAGEGAGRKKAFFLFLFALLAWGAAFSFWMDARDLRSRRMLQRARFNDLVSVLREYSAVRALQGGTAVSEKALSAPLNEDLLTTVSNVVTTLGLRNNMLSLSSTSARGGQNAVSLTLEGLSAESLARFLQETERRGVFAFSADLRAVRGNEERRTLTVFLLLGGVL